MTTDEGTDFCALMASESATSLDMNFEHDKDLSILNCVDLFPNPPKYIPDLDQAFNQGLNLNLECESFSGFSDDVNKSSAVFMDSQVNHIDGNDNNNSDHYEFNNENEHNLGGGKTQSNINSYKKNGKYPKLNGVKDKNEDSKQLLFLLNKKSSNGNKEDKEYKISKKLGRHGKDAHKHNHAEIKIEDKVVSKVSVALPASSPSLSISSYCSSAESVTSETTSKKKRKRYCRACNIKFRHTKEFLAHLKTHVSLPSVVVTKLCENDIISKKYHRKPQESHKEPEIEHGSLKLKLKLSASQNFEVVPMNEKPDTPTIVEEKSTPTENTSTVVGKETIVEKETTVEEKSNFVEKKSTLVEEVSTRAEEKSTSLEEKSTNVEEKPKKGGIRILKAKEIKMSPPTTPTNAPTIHAVNRMSEDSMKQQQSQSMSLENRYFECPTFDGLDQFVEDVPPEAAEDLLKKLLEGNSQQISSEFDWSTNTSEFIPIDRLAHICPICNKNFPDSGSLFEHKRLTGHDCNNQMHPPPPPPPKNHMNMNQYNVMRNIFNPQHMQMNQNQGYPSHPSHPPHPSLHQHMQYMQHSQQPSNPPQFNQRPPFSQLNSMGTRPGYPSYFPQPPRYPTLPQNCTQSQMEYRRPPPLYRARSPQNMSAATQPYSNMNMNQNIFYPPNPNAIVNGPGTSSAPFQNMQKEPDTTKSSVFLKAKLQKGIRPKQPNSKANPSSPITLSQQQITRPKFLLPNNGSQHPVPIMNQFPLNNSQLDSSRNNSNDPPTKKSKYDSDDCEVISTQLRMDGVPIIQNVQGGASLPSPDNERETSRDSVQLNDQITLSLRKTEKNNNPKEVANILANRGITVTHKPKISGGQEDLSKNALTQEAVQKLQLNNSVSIISKKKSEVNGNGSGNGNGNGDAGQISKGGDSESPFISCPIPDCEEKFLSQESLNRHTQRGHRMNKMNLRPFRCKICPAMFSTAEGLVDHQRRAHRIIKTSADELGIPVVDLRNERTKQKLAALGILNYIPLSSRGSNGCFGFPIVSVQGASNPSICNVLGMGINSILSLGPVKPILTKKH